MGKKQLQYKDPVPLASHFLPPYTCTHIYAYTQCLHNFRKKPIYWVNNNFKYIPLSLKSKMHILKSHLPYNLFLKLASKVKQSDHNISFLNDHILKFDVIPVKHWINGRIWVVFGLPVQGKSSWVELHSWFFPLQK